MRPAELPEDTAGESPELFEAAACEFALPELFEDSARELVPAELFDDSARVLAVLLEDSALELVAAEEDSRELLLPESR